MDEALTPEEIQKKKARAEKAADDLTKGLNDKPRPGTTASTEAQPGAAIAPAPAFEKFNSLKWINPTEIKVDNEFSNLYEIHPEVEASITESMKASGFNKAHPVLVWKETGILIDGHTRRRAAIAAGRELIAVHFISFPDRDGKPDRAAALAYADDLQMHRRNLTEWDRLRHLEKRLSKAPAESKNKKKRTKGRPTVEINKEQAALILKVSEATAAKYLKVLKEADEGMKQQIKAGELSINQAWKALSDKGQPEPENSPDELNLTVRQKSDQPKITGKTASKSPEKTSKKPEKTLKTILESIASTAAKEKLTVQKVFEELAGELEKSGFLKSQEVRKILDIARGETE